MNKKLKFNKIISYVVLLFMPLSIYPIIANAITLGDLAIFITLIFIILKTIKENTTLKIVMPLFIYCSMIIVLSLMHWAIGIENITEGFFSILRYLLYIVFCMIVSKNNFNFKDTYTAYKKIALFIAIYAIMQFISYKLFHKILPSNILSLKTFTGVYKYNDIYRYSKDYMIYRPCGVFAEPAHLASYLAPILYMLINDIYEKNSKNKWLAIIIIISLLMSGSTTGIMAIGFSIIKPIGKTLKKDFAKKSILIILLIILGILFLKTNYGTSIYNRIIDTDKYGAMNSRFGNLSIVFSNSYNIFIGNGLKIDTMGYVPSYPQLLVSFGIVGVLVYIITIIMTFSRCNNIGKNILILFLFISLGTLALFGVASIIYFVLIYSNYCKKDEVKTTT